MIWQWPDDLRRVFGERNSASEVYYDNLLWHTGLTAIQSNRQQDNNYKTHTHYYKEKTNKPTHTHTHTHTDTETDTDTDTGAQAQAQAHAHTHTHTNTKFTHERMTVVLENFLKGHRHVLYHHLKV